MERKEFVFEIKEVRHRYNPHYTGNREAYLSIRTGTAYIQGDDIEVYVDDNSQPSGILKSTDKKFKKLLKSIFYGSR